MAPWVLLLVLELLTHEDEHSQGSPCMGDLLRMVPADVLAFARQLRAMGLAGAVIAALAQREDPREWH
jgi:hypothetical protein